MQPASVFLHLSLVGSARVPTMARVWYGCRFWEKKYGVSSSKI